MREAPISRRSLLLAGAGALAGAAMHPPVSVGALSRPGGPRLGRIELGSLRAGSTVIELPVGVDLVGLQWTGQTHAHPEVRVMLTGGRWGPWASADAHGHVPDHWSSAPATGEPLWTGGARRIELRSAGTLEGARLYLVSAGAPSGASAGAAALQLATPVLPAGPGQPPIIARRAWGVGIQAPRVAPEYGAVELGFVHHTENPNGYSAGQVPAMLRAIYYFHRNVNGWNDIGYNFVVDLYGRIFEARAGGIDEPVVGAHAGGYNLYSSGVAVLGSFSGTPISSAAKNALERLLAWKLSLHGTPATGRVTVRVNPAGAVYSKYPANARVSLPRVAGHRDADSTECPGDVLYGELGGIRGTVRRLAGDPVQALLSFVPAAPASEQAPVTPTPAPPGAATPAQLQLTVRTVSGAALADAAVVFQGRTVSRRGLAVKEATLAEGVTDANGLCTIPVTFAAGAAKTLQVRALYAGGSGHGAAVSRAVGVPPQPALTPAPTTAPTA